MSDDARQRGERGTSSAVRIAFPESSEISAQGYLIVPRTDREHARETFAAAAVARSPSDLKLRSPERDAMDILQRIGLTQLASPLSSTTQAMRVALQHKSEGVAARLENLGITVAYFMNEAGREKAEEALGQDCIFVPNASMELPAQLPSSTSPAELEEQTSARHAYRPPRKSQWPIQSGVTLAHDDGVRGAGVLIGVLDTGVDADHKEFAKKIINFRYEPLGPMHPSGRARHVRGFDTAVHGTHVCGILAGNRIGVAPEADLYVASVIERETARSSLIRTINGLNWLLREFATDAARKKPAIINMSLGFSPDGVQGMSQSQYLTTMDFMDRIIKTLGDANILTVVAIGNDGPGNYRLPGGSEAAVGVGAVDFQHRVAEFSGSRIGAVAKPDIYGYAVNVMSAYERDYSGRSSYHDMSGTSMATPFVTGVAALNLCKNNRLSALELRKRLVDDAVNVDGVRIAAYSTSR